MKPADWEERMRRLGGKLADDLGDTAAADAVVDIPAEVLESVAGLDGGEPTPRMEQDAAGNSRYAGSTGFGRKSGTATGGYDEPMSMDEAKNVIDQMLGKLDEVPEFLRDDLLEGVLVGAGIGLPIALMGEQDPHEKAGTVLSAMTAATLGGAASRRIGKWIGGQVHPGELEAGSFNANLGRMMGRDSMLSDPLRDVLAIGDKPKITGEHAGQAYGRLVGDEVFGVAGALGGLALAQSMDNTPDAQPQPTIGDAAWGAIPGAIAGLAISGAGSGMFDLGMARNHVEEAEEAEKRYAAAAAANYPSDWGNPDDTDWRMWDHERWRHGRGSTL